MARPDTDPFRPLFLHVLARRTAVIVAAAALLIGAGWTRPHASSRGRYRTPAPPAPLGAQSDAIWKIQEANAEASEFVVYQHEFEYNGVRLNAAGEDHVKQIAVRLLAGADVPVVVQRSTTSVREETENKYPVHPNPALDLRRREVIVRSLGAMGVADTDRRVAVAPAYSHPLKATEAAAAYQRSLGAWGYRGYGAYGRSGGTP